MVFSSITFLFFFLPITLSVYFVGGKRLRNFILFSVSLVFYAWGETYYVAIMIVSILFNYVSGMGIERSSSRRKWILIAGLGLNLGLLCTFKYANFFVDNLNVLLASINLRPIFLNPVHLPIGISFFTFQAMSYLIDVYKKKTAAQYNIINLGLYISLFPQLIAGPIIRYHDISYQIENRKTDLDKFSQGAKRFIIGLGKKVLIANTLALPADKIFALANHDLTTGLAWLGIVAYALQIYYDFSGYSDMAIGLGGMFGFVIPENFNLPYSAKSIREFWRRWHISLSNWFRDYLYIPLGGNRKGKYRTYVNLLIVFFLTGLWHGASWNFVIWGMFHGFFLVIERSGLDKYLEKSRLPVGNLYVLLVVIVAWVFFRAESLGQSLSYLAAMFGYAAGTDTTYHLARLLDLEVIFALVFGILLSYPRFIILPSKCNLNHSISVLRQTSRGFGITFETAKVTFLVVIFVASVMNLSYGTYNPFIYFRF